MPVNRNEPLYHTDGRPRRQLVEFYNEIILGLESGSTTATSSFQARGSTQEKLAVLHVIAGKTSARATRGGD